ncbi:MAG: murein L,D-transpeptidase family protein [Pseudomonadota bacterium]
MFNRFFVGCLLLIWMNASALADIPTSARAKAAIKRVKPLLKDALKAKGLAYGAPLFVRIFKATNELEVWLEAANGKFKLFRTYPICHYSGSLGPKQKQGDRQSPEGFYYVRPRQMNPYSQFHLSFNLGYPNAYERAHGYTGDYLMVHGNCVSIGCYAMTDKKIEEIYALANAALSNGQAFFRVHAFPFRMTSENMREYSDSPWIGFWRNLKTGYDFFENTGRVPNVRVKNRQYIFE